MMARDYRKEYDNYQGAEVQKKNRAKRNAARAKMVKAGRASKGDGKDVDHVVPLSKGGANIAGNLRVKSKSANRSFKRKSNGAVK
jgi:hypothetical protein